MLSLPLGPSNFTSSPATDAFTLSASLIGNFPIRLIGSSASALVDGANQLASDILLARLVVHHHSPRGGEDRNPQAAEHPGNVPNRDVPANPRLGDPPDAGEHGRP